MVRSIGVDPFKMVYFMEEEFGKVTMQNRVMNPSHERIVKAYIDHYTEGHYKTIGTVAMRQTNVTIDDKPAYGLTFVTGIVPFYTSPLLDIIYIPSTIYSRGMFVFLEDAIGEVLRELSSIFDEELKLERELPYKYELFESLRRAFQKDDAKLNASDGEAWNILVQSETINHLKTFFEAMLRATVYSHFRTVGFDRKEHGFFDSIVGDRWDFVGEVDLSTLIPEVRRGPKGELTVDSSKIPLSFILTYAALRRLLRTFNPGLVDDQKGFDRKVTRRLLAQALYNEVYMGEDRKVQEGKARLTSGIAKPVDTILRYMDLIDSDKFQSLTLEDKMLQYNKLNREVEMQIQEEKR